MDIYKAKPSAPQPSPILTWFEANYRRRAQGKLNGLDINEIKVALSGARNRWTERVLKERKLLESLIKAVEGCDANKENANKIWTQMMG